MAAKSGIPVMATSQTSQGGKDDFKIGDRVWINGTKPGRVAFIGLTKFAAGDWVGVNLDEPQGKNDGAVGGVSYFKCKPLHGVFSRASRLSRQQNLDLTDVAATAEKSEANGKSKTSDSFPIASTPRVSDRASAERTRVRESVSPTPSERSTTLSPAGSTTSVASVGGVPKVGDRVIVSNQTTGSKTGTLRYAGPTDFAAGEWAGVELDTPAGKNDGTVGEKRYFECQPNYGIFVPMSKITKSPKNKMQKMVVAPSPAKLCRQRSDMSERSVASTLDSSAISGKTPKPKQKLSVSSLNAPERLRASVKEKEQQIEQLLKERDLERSEVAKAAMQTDEAELQLNKLKKEFTAYKMDMEKRVADLLTSLNDKGKRLMETSTELDDERKKFEDLQFRMEEDEIMRDEATKAGNVQELLNKIRDLEAKLAAEQKAKSELDGGKSQFELQIRQLEEQLGMERKLSVTHQAGAAEQLSLMSAQLHSQQQVAQKALAEKDKLEERLAFLEKSLEEKSNECMFLGEETQLKLSDADEKIISLTQQLDAMKSDLKTSSEKMSFEQKKFVSMNDTLKEELDQALEKMNTLEKALSDKERASIHFEQKLDSEKQTIISTKAMLEDKISEVQTIKSECQELKHQVASKDTELQDLIKKLNNLNEKFEAVSTVTSEKESTFKEVVANHSAKEKALQREIEELRGQLDQSGADSHERWTKMAEEAKKATSQLEESERKLREKSKECQTIKSEMEDANERLAMAEKASNNLASEKEDLEKRISLLRESTQTSSDEVKRLSGTLTLKDVEVESLRHDLALLSDQLQELKGVITKTEGDYSDKIEELTRQHKKSSVEAEDRLKKVEQAKEKLEKSRDETIQNLNEKFRVASEEYAETIQTLKQDLSRRESVVASLNKKVEQLNNELSEKTGNASDAYAKLNEDHQQLEQELFSKAQEIELMQSDRRRLDQELTKARDRLKDLEKIKDDKEAISFQMAEQTSEMQLLRESIAGHEKEKSSLEAQLNKLREVGSNSSEQLSKANQEIASKNSEIKTLREEISKLKLESSSLKEHLEVSKSKLAEEISRLEKVKAEAVTKLTEDAESLKKSLEEKKLDISNLKLQLADLTKAQHDKINEMNKELSDKENLLNKANQDLTQEHSNGQRLGQELRGATQQILELKESLETLQRTHDEEMGEMVDLVNELKLKEDTLMRTGERLEEALSDLDKSKNDVSRLEEKHSEEMKFAREKSEKEIKTLSGKLEEAQNQIRYLKDSLASAKVDLDLQLEKVDRERNSLTDTHKAELEMKNVTIAKLKEDLANKETLLDITKEELASKTEELQDLMVDLEVKEAGFNNSFRENTETHKEEIEVLVSKVEDAKREISELHESLARTKAEHATAVDEMLKARKTEINSLQDEISEKDRKILDLDGDLYEVKRQLQDAHASSESEAKLIQLKVEQMTKENDELRGQKRDLESSVRKLQSEHMQAVHQNEELSYKIVEKERQVREVSSQVQSMRMTYEKTQKELSERLERSTQDSSALVEVQKALEGERLRVDELQVTLGDVESERDSYLEKLSDYEKVRQQVSEFEEREQLLMKTIEDLKIKHSFSLEEFEAERSELNDVVQRSKHLLQEKLEEFKSQKSEYEKLLIENQQLNSYKRSILMLEQEKRELENRLAISSVKSYTAIESDATLTDNDELRCQVDFLNSVIVDMQRKNDEYKAKLDLLESAGVLETIDVGDLMMMNGVDGRKVAPRLFCDICDRFDLHDTEDCPMQSMQQEEDLPVTTINLDASLNTSSSGHTKSGGVRGALRSYCDKCEVFGHETEGCNVEESY